MATKRQFIATALVLASWTLISSAVQKPAWAGVASAEGPTEAFAKAQVQRQLPKHITQPQFECKEKDVGFSSRWRCTARWDH
jgi:hypothetical protein